MLTVSSVNVNGIRAAAAKGFTAWLSNTAADIVCLQEIRAEVEEVPPQLRAVLDTWHLTWVPSQIARGRAGVAVLTRRPPEAVRVGFGSTEFDRSGRYVEVDLPGLTVASLYLPKGEAGTPRQEAKDRFLNVFGAHLRERREKAIVDGREVLVCGDWNIAHTTADIRNWRGNLRSSGFLPHEREWFGALLDAGYVDVVRKVHPDTNGPYTWWSYRGRAFDNDVGWRIDHHVATAGLAARAVSAVVERAPSYHARWSDHAPVTVCYATDEKTANSGSSVEVPDAAT